MQVLKNFVFCRISVSHENITCIRSPVLKRKYLTSLKNIGLQAFNQKVREINGTSLE